jgi:hypothetical protein
MIEIKEPDYDEKWFKWRAEQALSIFESRRTPRHKGREQYLNVLAGIFRHAYSKGRHDEKRDQQARITMLNKFEDKVNG